MLEKEVFCTPSFSLNCSMASEAKKRVGYFKTGSGKSELIVLFHISCQNMPPHYSFTFTNDLARKLHTKLWALFGVVDGEQGGRE